MPQSPQFRKEFQVNEIAKEGQIFVCSACGKMSSDLYGEQKISRGWDQFCSLNAILCLEDKLEYDINGRVKYVPEDGIVRELFQQEKSKIVTS
jgi:hypothetical protein